MKRIKDFFWPLLGLAAILWSLDVLYTKLRSEAAADAATALLIENSTFLESLKIIFVQIGMRLNAIPLHGYLLAMAATACAYFALAWYDRIALIHLDKEKGISWPFITLCSFVTYAISHNIGGSVFSGGMVRYRAYKSKGLTAPEIAVLVALCSFTFAFGTTLLGGMVLIYEPQIVRPLAKIDQFWVILAGLAMVALCLLYTLGSWLQFKPLEIRAFKLEYPRLNVVWRQWLAAPLELIGAAGIIFFVLPEQGNPGYMIVLGAFLLSFSAGLLFQVPGGLGVMEAVFLKVMPSIPPSDVIAALLVWRLFYLLIPLALSLPIVWLFEQGQLRAKADGTGQAS